MMIRFFENVKMSRKLRELNYTEWFQWRGTVCHKHFGHQYYYRV